MSIQNNLLVTQEQIDTYNRVTDQEETLLRPSLGMRIRPDLESNFVSTPWGNRKIEDITGALLPLVVSISLCVVSALASQFGTLLFLASLVGGIYSVVQFDHLSNPPTNELNDPTHRERMVLNFQHKTLKDIAELDWDSRVTHYKLLGENPKVYVVYKHYVNAFQGINSVYQTRKVEILENPTQSNNTILQNQIQTLNLDRSLGELETTYRNSVDLLNQSFQLKRQTLARAN